MITHRPLPVLLRAQLYQHLAAMEKAGIPSERAYALLDLGPAARERIASFQRLVARRVDPATAGANSGLFTLFESRILRAAFAAGSPLPSFSRLAQFYAAKVNQQGVLRSRLVFPVATLALALFIGPIPALVNGQITAALYLAQAAAPLALLAVLAFAWLRLRAWFVSGDAGPGRALLEQTLVGLPLFGPMHVRRNARDFIESLGLLLHAGLPLFEALPPALDTVDNSIVRRALASVLPAVKSGRTLAQAIGALDLVDTTELFPFVHTGEQSGTLPEMLQRHASSETEAINAFQMEIVGWGPRLFYALVALWMVTQLLAFAR
ncbi:MAG: type II secretion system F family protein [Pseudomonadota bacterium]